MSSRRPRARFAAPLVVTLAMAPACVVHTGTSAPPAHTGITVGDHRTGEPTPTPTPRPIMNPPRPIAGGTSSSPPVAPRPPGPIMNPPAPDRVGPSTPPPIKQTTPAIDVVQAGPTPQAPQAGPTTWRVTQRIKDKVCFATLDVPCPPAPATCNPPPAHKLASCPDGVAGTPALTIRELTAGACFLVYPMPTCPAGTACNPPRPAAIACPR